MKIGVISDTHINDISSHKLSEKVYEYFKECSLIIHAGDITNISVIKELEKIAKTYVVCGNMDDIGIRKQYKEKIVINVKGKNIGVVHGKGFDLNVISNLQKAFKKKLDIIVFGHSHVSLKKVENGVLFFNPGSATDNIFCDCCSIGIIDIQQDNILANIIKI